MFSIHPQPPALIINDGSLPALIASWAEGLRQDGEIATDEQRRTRGPIAWYPAGFPPCRTGAAPRRRALEQQFELCQLAGLSDQSALVWTGAGADGAPGADAARSQASFGDSLLTSVGVGGSSGSGGAGWQSAMLLAAGLEALSCGRPRVVWPVCCGRERASLGREGNLAEIADLCDRAMLAAQLVGIDAARGGLTIETPFVDLSDDQLIELAMDLGTPLHACWWCERDAEDPNAAPCGQCPECRRWNAAIGGDAPVTPNVVVRPAPALKPTRGPGGA